MPVQAPGHNAALISFLILALYTVFACLYSMLPHLSFFLHFFLLISSLIFSFEVECHKRRLNLALFFCVYFVFIFCVVVHFF